VKARRDEWGAVAALVAGVIVVSLVLCHTARAQAPLRFGQLKPAYIASDYSNSDGWDKEQAPYLKAQASMFMTVLRNPLVVKGLTFNPELAFTWQANKRQVGAESSPITESIYSPEAFVRVAEDTTGYFRGGRVGWLHNSSGTDSASASIDRVLLETKWAYSLPFQGRVLELTGYARGWYVLQTGSGTEDIMAYINTSFWEDAGGELMLVAEVPEVIRAVVEVGLSYQHYELYVPLAKAYDIDLFGQIHAGNANGIVEYADRATSGGVGLALVR
jgi:outer membrane phospholipase A